VKIRQALLIGGGIAALGCSLWAFQKPFREYPAIEYNDFPVPDDYRQPAEFTFARLMYPPAATARFDRAGRYWAQGMSSWTQDYPRADRHLAQALRRLTRINTRSVEQAVNLDDDDEVYNWPWVYAVRTGEWDLTEAQAKRLRDYIERGGFLMVDDFWGTFEWQVFMRSMNRVFPDRPPVDVDNADALFHTIYDLNDRFRVTGAWGRFGRPYQDDGDTPYWRAIYDGKNRVVLAIVANSDLGDSWEYADDPSYPEKWSGLGIRVAVNYIAYGMTH